MSEQDRIAGMVEAGKLSPEEAAEILAALGELEAAEQTLEAAQAEISSSVSAPEAAMSEKATQRPASAHGAASAGAASLPIDWLRIDFMAGDVRVWADDALSEPVIDEGKLRLERSGDDFVVSAADAKPPKPAGTLLEDMGGWLSKMTSRIGDVSVRVPPRYGVELKSKAGDIEVSGVAFLKAELLAGDVDICDVGGLELSATAGDIDISFAPQGGKHRIEATAGDVDIRLAAASSVSVNANVGMGEIDVLRQDGGEVTKTSSMTGEASSFKVGAGAAQLDISLSAGELDIIVGDTTVEDKVARDKA